MNILEPNHLFNTPESKEEFAAWLDSLKGEEKFIAVNAAAMAWNLAAKLVKEATS